MPVTMSGFKGLLKSPSQSAFPRFILSGAVNTLFGYSVFALLIFIGTGPQPALILTTCIGVLFNYVTSSRFVFKGLADRLAFARFISAYAATYVVNAGILELLMRGFTLSAYSAQIILMPLIALLTFILMRNWVFKARGVA